MLGAKIHKKRPEDHLQAFLNLASHLENKLCLNLDTYRISMAAACMFKNNQTLMPALRLNGINVNILFFENSFDGKTIKRQVSETNYWNKIGLVNAYHI